MLSETKHKHCKGRGTSHSCDPPPSSGRARHAQLFPDGNHNLSLSQPPWHLLQTRLHTVGRIPLIPSPGPPSHPGHGTRVCLCTIETELEEEDGSLTPSTCQPQDSLLKGGGCKFLWCRLLLPSLKRQAVTVLRSDGSETDVFSHRATDLPQPAVQGSCEHSSALSGCCQ